MTETSVPKNHKVFGACSVGDTVKNRITGTKGEIVGISNLGLYEINYKGVGLRRNQPESTLELVAAGFLHIDEQRPDLADFISYLRTPEARTRLYFKVIAGKRADMLRAQYRELSGEELVEGEGFCIQEAHKHGAEGQVNFRTPTNVPESIRELMIQGDGIINRLPFVWLLVKEGFTATR